MRRLLFLDFDGVLNNTPWAVSEARRVMRATAKLKPGADWRSVRAAGDFDPANMARLADLVRYVRGLEVVVSSSWRKGNTLAQLRHLLRAAVPARRVMGATGTDPTRERHREIRTWLDVHECAEERYLALDDDSFDMLPLGANFLHVDRNTGLTAAHVVAAVQHFRGDK